MKRFITLLPALLPVIISAQNIQLHYDFGQPENGPKRNFFVSTFELFRPDTLGYTFLFTDFEFDSPDKPRGTSLGYFEISRSFNILTPNKSNPFNHLMLRLEYNDGSAIFATDDSTILGANLYSSWLGGIEYSLVSGNLSLNFMAQYKYIRGSSAPDMQFTIVWYYQLFRNRLTLTGYIDIWSQDDFFHDRKNKIPVYYSEPQFWWNINNHLSVGNL